MVKISWRLPQRSKIPRLPGVPREPRGFGRSEATLIPRGMRGLESFRVEKPAGEPPLWWRQRYPGGTEPEWAVFWALVKLGYQPEVDFFMHAVLPGAGRGFYSQVDFLLPDQGIGIEVSGLYWHYTLGSERQERDLFRLLYFAERGIQIIFIDEDDAIRDPLYYVREALEGRDHSKLRRAV
jgi:hypothetical protein